jgi:hypothetical protein
MASPLGEQVVRVEMALAGVACPACDHQVAKLVVDLPLASEIDGQPTVIEDQQAVFMVRLTAGQPIPVTIACAHCERSVKYGTHPPSLQRALRSWLGAA